MNKTMHLLRPTVAAAIAMAAATVSAGEVPADTLLSRVSEHHSPERAITGMPYDNPALRPFNRSWSYSTAAIGWEYDMAQKPVAMQSGRGYNGWMFDADSYMKLGRSTVWGRAYYRNGRRHDILWNETSDADRLYPYLTADAAGGDMNREEYHFSGGYSCPGRNLSWGVSAGYTAELEYRRVDPRPRNVTSRLEARGGIAIRILPGYMAGVSGLLEKYKQTCSIRFVSELGSIKIYHLTGLGTDYSRFAGNGTSSYYNGWAYGGTVNLYPVSSRGFMASIEARRFSFDKILSDLNRLPLVHATETSLKAQAAWRSQRLTIAADGCLTARHGTENIFGDASSSAYPQIGSLPQYNRHTASAAVYGVWRQPAGVASLTVMPVFRYDSDIEKYSHPSGKIATTTIQPSINCGADIRAGRRTLLEIGCGWSLRSPLTATMALPDPSSAASAPALNDFIYRQGSSREISLSAAATSAITSRYALRLSVAASDTRYPTGVHRREARASIAMIF
ncbi:MAG: hypothetical protein K2L49_08470 [Muribaculaceae bacterium]|nr:hypothetical protein [Muribaculaceae bacterium]